ncbi:hypothetical protein VNO77_01938 [Canavalia gladiata]|uniref:Uncharacterized protein n=1 Tax=Canavalia gladiata TaxID=3824 RepID=A0AAN9MWY2_CANGL
MCGSQAWTFKMFLVIGLFRESSQDSSCHPSSEGYYIHLEIYEDYLTLARKEGVEIDHIKKQRRPTGDMVKYEFKFKLSPRLSFLFQLPEGANLTCCGDEAETKNRVNFEPSDSSSLDPSICLSSLLISLNLDPFFLLEFHQASPSSDPKKKSPENHSLEVAPMVTTELDAFEISYRSKAWFGFIILIGWGTQIAAPVVNRRSNQHKFNFRSVTRVYQIS